MKVAPSNLAAGRFSFTKFSGPSPQPSALVSPPWAPPFLKPAPGTSIVRDSGNVERVPGDLHHSGSIGRVRIGVSAPTEDHRVWGVATWDNVDPRTDFISIFVQGLTNAYRWQPPADGYKPNTQVEQDQVLSKTLKLNFWRPGDAIDLHEGEIRFGVPLYPQEPERQKEALEVYQIPKPV